MNEVELRALVQEVIARYTAARSGTGVTSFERISPAGPHASHGLFPVAPGSAGDGACLIEPAVRCNHCGYCRSLGH